MQIEIKSNECVLFDKFIHVFHNKTQCIGLSCCQDMFIVYLDNKREGGTWE